MSDDDGDHSTRIHALLHDYIKHILTPYESWTNAAANALCLREPVPLHDPRSLFHAPSPFVALERVYHFSEIKPYDEKFVLTKSSAENGHAGRDVMMALLKKALGLRVPEDGKCKTDRAYLEDSDPTTLFPSEDDLILAPILSRRARKATPRLGKGLARQSLPASFPELRSVPAPIHDMVEPKCARDGLLNLRLQLSVEEYGHVSSLIKATSVLAQGQSHSRDKCAPTLDAEDAVAVVPPWSPFEPIFPRSQRHGNASVARADVRVDRFIGPRTAPELVNSENFPITPVASTAGTTKTNANDADDDNMYQEHMVIVDGWQTYAVSSPPDISSPSSGSESQIDELMDDDDHNFPRHGEERLSSPPTDEPSYANAKVTRCGPPAFERMEPVIARSKIPANAGGRPISQVPFISSLSGKKFPPKIQAETSRKVDGPQVRDDDDDIEGSASGNHQGLKGFLVPILTNGSDTNKQTSLKSVRWAAPRGLAVGEAQEEASMTAGEPRTDAATAADSAVGPPYEGADRPGDDDHAEFESVIRGYVARVPREWRRDPRDIVMKATLQDDERQLSSVSAPARDKAANENNQHIYIGTFMDVPTLASPNVHVQNITAPPLPTNWNSIVMPKKTDSCAVKALGGGTPGSGNSGVIAFIQRDIAFLKQTKGMFPLNTQLSWIPWKSRSRLPTNAEITLVSSFDVLAGCSDTQTEELIRLALASDSVSVPGEDLEQRRWFPIDDIHPDTQVAGAESISGIDKFELVLSREERRRLAGLNRNWSEDNAAESCGDIEHNDQDEHITEASRTIVPKSLPVTQDFLEAPTTPTGQPSDVNDDESDKENGDLGGRPRKRPRLSQCDRPVHGQTAPRRQVLADADDSQVVSDGALNVDDFGPDEVPFFDLEGTCGYSQDAFKLANHQDGWFQSQDYDVSPRFEPYLDFQCDPGPPDRHAMFANDIDETDPLKALNSSFIASSHPATNYDASGFIASLGTSAHPSNVSDVSNTNALDAANDLADHLRFDYSHGGFTDSHWDYLEHKVLDEFETRHPEEDRAVLHAFSTFDDPPNSIVSGRTEEMPFFVWEPQQAKPEDHQLSRQYLPSETESPVFASYTCAAPLASSTQTIDPELLGQKSSAAPALAVVSPPPASSDTLEKRLNIAKPSVALDSFARLRAKALSTKSTDSEHIPATTATGRARHPTDQQGQAWNQDIEMPRGVPPDLIDSNTLVLSMPWPPPTKLHRYMACTALLQKQTLVRALHNPSLGHIEFAERDFLGPLPGDSSATSTLSETLSSQRDSCLGPDLVLSPEAVILFVPLLSLPARRPEVLARVAALSWRYERALVVFEAYPESQSLCPEKTISTRTLSGTSSSCSIDLYAYTPPILKAVKKLRRDLTVAEACGDKRGTPFVLYWAFADTPAEAAMFSRRFGDDLEAQASGPLSQLWGSREWLGDEALDNECELASVEGMNAFAAYVILCQVGLDGFLGLVPEMRMQSFGPLIGIERMSRLNSFIQRRMEEVDLES